MGTWEELVKPPPDPRLPDDSVVLWRYLDFTKFYSMLTGRALFFAQADSMTDPEEGAIYRGNSKAMLRALAKMAGEDPDAETKKIEQAEAAQQFVRKFFLLNCWHINQEESHAMWKIYLSSPEGLAVKTTFGKLKQSLAVYTNYRVRYGAVDYQRRVGSSYWGHFFSKSVYYEYEREFRVAVDMYEKLPEGDDFSKWLKTESANNLIRDQGIYVPVKLEVLITEIVVSPTSPAWLIRLIEKAVNESKLTVKVSPSSIKLK